MLRIESFENQKENDCKKPEICASITDKIVSMNRLLPDIGIMVRMFANGPGDLGSIPSRVIPKT